MCGARANTESLVTSSLLSNSSKWFSRNVRSGAKNFNHSQGTISDSMSAGNCWVIGRHV